MSHGETLFKFVRTLTAPEIAFDDQQRQHGRLVMLIEAVNEAMRMEQPTINIIADILGIDQSGASRLVSQAIAAGLIEREKSPGDGRQRRCSLTPEGVRFLKQARAWQENVFASLTADWHESERTIFVELMNRVIDTSQTDSRV